MNNFLCAKCDRLTNRMTSAKVVICGLFVCVSISQILFFLFSLLKAYLADIGTFYCRAK